MDKPRHGRSSNRRSKKKMRPASKSPSTPWTNRGMGGVQTADQRRRCDPPQRVLRRHGQTEAWEEFKPQIKEEDATRLKESFDAMDKPRHGRSSNRRSKKKMRPASKSPSTPWTNR